MSENQDKFSKFNEHKNFANYCEIVLNVFQNMIHEYYLNIFYRIIFLYKDM